MKLLDLIGEHAEEQKPYMYSAVGFGCHVCEYYYKRDGKHMCNNRDYIEWMGTEELVDESGRQIEDPSKWCSNWFEPIKQKK